MYAPLLLSLLLSGAPDGTVHARLHPASAGLYIEVPDGAAACAAYGQAPLLRLVGDAKIQELLGAFGMNFEPNLDTALQWVGDQMELGFPLTELTQGVHAMSASFSMGDQGFGFMAVVELETAELAGKLKTLVLEHVRSHEPHELSGFEKLESEHVSFPLWLTVRGNQLALGSGVGSAEGFVERHGGNGATFADNDVLKSNLAGLGSAEGTPLFLFCQTGALPLAPMLPGDLPPGLRAGLAAVLEAPCAARTQFTDGHFLTRIFTAGNAKLFDGAFATADLDKNWLDDLPGDAMLTGATTIDGAKLAGLVHKLFELDPQVAATLKGLEEKLGFGVDRPLSKLGPRVLVSMQPLAGLGLPPAYAWIDSEDPEGFVADIEALAAGIGEFMPGVSAKSREYRVKNRETGERYAVPYTTITLPPEFSQMGMFAPKPTFARLENRLLFSLSSVALKSELKRIYAGAKEEGEPSFRAKHGDEVQQGTHTLFVLDWNIFFGKLMSLARTMAPMLGDLPFDLAKLPGPDLFERYLRATVHSARRVDGGTLREHRSSFGLEMWLVLFVGAIFDAQQVSGTTRDGSVPITEPLVDVEDKADAATQKTIQALQEIEAGLTVYRIENNSPPAELAALTTVSNDYPRGYLASNALPTDGWGRAFHYARTGDDYRLWSSGPNGIDENGAGDDVVP